MWTEQEASAKFEDVLRRAQTGEVQVIGVTDPCVLITLAEYQRLTRSVDEPHFGRWLIANAPRIGDLELPPRDKERPNPFADFLDEEERAG